MALEQISDSEFLCDDSFGVIDAGLDFGCPSARQVHLFLVSIVAKVVA